jgi:hypothetical protein
LGGIKYITAGGDKGKVEEAKTSITHAITGLTIVAASWAIFLVLNHFFGLGMVGGARNIPGTTPPRTSNPPPVTVSVAMAAAPIVLPKLVVAPPTANVTNAILQQEAGISCTKIQLKLNLI